MKKIEKKRADGGALSKYSVRIIEPVEKVGLRDGDILCQERLV